MTTRLPIEDVLPAIVASLATTPNLVLQAPPGAGKTTGVPPALLDANWLAGKKIVMIEPRRLAARAAASRIARNLGDEVGGIAGYRVRMDTKVSARTRIELVTDGVFTRMIQEDPSLEKIGAVLFDEIHERRLETDLGLALALESQAALRPDLRLIAMSATLDAAPVARALRDAPIITAQGRAFPVEIRNLPAPASGLDALAVAMRDAILDALSGGDGDVLVFLPGGAEIRRVERALQAARLADNIDVMPLFGDLPPAQQDRAIAPSIKGRRKIVLATSIAETSLTIEGVRHVVDSGLARNARYDPATGLTKLVTEKVSRAGAEQRAGRAGRVAPGTARRLWPAAAHGALPEFTAPEIATADLAPFALELAAWGVEHPSALNLLDQPPASAWNEARALLTELDALDKDGRITAHGKAMSRFGAHPRLAHMLLHAKSGTAAALAALLGERDAGPNDDVDLRPRIDRVAKFSDEPWRRIREQAKRFARQAHADFADIASEDAGETLALAYPDRVAQQRGGRGRFRLANGRGAALNERDPLAGEAFLVVAELDGAGADSRIRLAAPLTETALRRVLGPHIEEIDEIELNDAGAVVATRRTKLGALVLAEKALPKPPPDALAAALLDRVRKRGLSVLHFSDAARELQARVALLRDKDSEAWPDLSDAHLLATVGDWLTIGSARKLEEIAIEPLLRQRLDWKQAQELDARAPTHFTAPTGSRVPIDYSVANPTVRIRVQELFGLTQHPAIDRNRIPLTLELLSPAQRPIQVTRDLPGFWAGSWKAVRADLRGRYPRHPWPEDPAAAEPTRRVKPRGT
ncbi:ATP-dependent helicase HrpB [Roseiterribacter gracilis]|uniref:RNA helicase n=1 Tax=Roseiterribacter gracilis TaxID=2812848 RepID=A0A8S8X790_9PROT|nr:helicase [Rhodospirillales bacterium TMPK1]